MFDATIETLEAGRVMRYRLVEQRQPLSFARVLSLWQNEHSFREVFAALLINSPFGGYRFETPVLTRSTTDRAFEFVLVSAPGFVHRAVDAKTYEKHFRADGPHEGVVSFGNLSGDATLIVPSPRGPTSSYGHLAAFMRNACREQVDALWQVVGQTIVANLTDQPLRLSTAGGGVAWLHVRLDRSPKYYAFAEYKNA